MKNKDYIDIVVNFIGDSAGSVPLAGGFITAVKNSAYNIAQKKQYDRIISFLEELEKRIECIEDKFTLLINDSRFSTHFYQTLYLIKDTYDDDQFEAYLGFISNYFEQDYDDFEMDLTMNILNSMSPYSWKLLKKIYNDNGEEKFTAREYFLPDMPLSTKTTHYVDYEDLDYKTHKSLSDLINLELLQAQENILRSLRSIGRIDILKVSKKGKAILCLLNNQRKEQQTS